MHKADCKVTECVRKGWQLSVVGRQNSKSVNQQQGTFRLDSREVSAYLSLHGTLGMQHLGRLLERLSQRVLRIGYFDMFKKYRCSCPCFRGGALVR